MTARIVVHGGAGPAEAGDVSDQLKSGCLRAAGEGFKVLIQGGSALDAVEAAVAALEDDPQFNAGTGACLNRDGEVETDASLMEGATLRAGAVAAVHGIRNPIHLARQVMERTPHVLLTGEGARELAREIGMALIDPSALVTPRAEAKLRAWRGKPTSPFGGTVGAVAIDRNGHLAAATSTGGMTGKRRGRVGDSPLIGAGTYSDDRAGAASTTGHGEAIIRVALCKFACDQMRAGAPAAAAAKRAILELERVEGKGGIILLDTQGRAGWAINTAHMPRAWIDETGEHADY